MRQPGVIVKTVLAVVTALAVSVASAGGQVPQGFKMPDGFDAGKPLTPGGVGRLLDSYGELVETFNDYESDDNGRGFGEYVRANNAQSKVNAIVQKHGFENWLDWYQQFLRAIRAYSSLKMQNAQAGQAQLDKQIEQIKNNPDISEEQKNQMLAMIQASQGFVQSMANADPGDIEAIKPHMKRFEEVLNESEK